MPKHEMKDKKFWETELTTSLYEIFSNYDIDTKIVFNRDCKVIHIDGGVVTLMYKQTA